MINQVKGFCFYISLIVILFSIPTFSLVAQSNTIEEDWIKFYGGKRADAIYDLAQTLDGKILGIGQSRAGLESAYKGSYKKEKKKSTLSQDGGNDDIMFFTMNENGKVEDIKAIGLNKKEGAYAIYPTLDGGVVIAGFTNSPTQAALGNKDAWLIKLDRAGNHIWDQRMGGTGSDLFRDVIELDNGDIVACGQIDNQVYVVRLDWTGNILKESTLPLDGHQQIGCSMVALSDGNIGMVGLMNDHKKDYTFYTTLNSSLKPIGKIQTYFERWKDKNKKADVLTESADLIEYNQSLFITSSSDPDAVNYKVGLVQCDLSGNILKDGKKERRYYFGDANSSVPFKMVRGTDDHIYITGASKSHNKGGSANKNKFFLLGIDKTGKALWEDPMIFFGGNFEDRACTLLQHKNGSIYLGGWTNSKNSFFGGGKDGCIVKTKKIKAATSEDSEILITDTKFIDASGDGKLEPNERGYFQFRLTNNGDSNVDNIKALVEKKTGSRQLDFLSEIFFAPLFAGASKVYGIPVIGKKDLVASTSEFAISFQADGTRKIPDTKFSINTLAEKEANLVFEKIQPGSNELIQKEEIVELSFSLKNDGELAAENITGIFHYDNATLVEVQSDKKIKIGSINPGESKQVRFKFKLNRLYRAENLDIKFTYATSKIQAYDVIRKFSLAVNPEVKAPSFKIDDAAWLPKKLQYEKGETITLNVKITNVGSAKATELKSTFQPQKGLTPLSPLELKKASLDIGKPWVASLKFKIDSDFAEKKASISLGLVSSEKGLVKKSYTIGIEEAPVEPVPAIEEIPVEMEIFWENPEEEVITQKDNKYVFEFEAEVNQEIDFKVDQFLFTLNGKNIKEEDTKSGEIKLSKIRKKKRGNKMLYIFSQTFELLEGGNKLQISYTVGENIFVSNYKIVKFYPEKPNLHFVGIGIGSFKDQFAFSALKFTSNDIQNVFDAFKLQEGKLYAKVNPYLICDDCKDSDTSKDGIIYLFDQLLSKNATGDLPKDDIIVVYISSHGQRVNDEFCIIPSSYRITEFKQERFVVNFEKDIISNLKAIGNTSFIFVDACHSGAIETFDDQFLRAAPTTDEATILEDLLSSNNLGKLRPITSSSGGQKSWEHESWKNGAFTEAFLEALANKKITLSDGNTLQANSNEDGLLTFTEIYKYLSARVPDLVKKITEGAAEQTPYIPENLLNLKNDGFYLLNKE